MPHLQSARRTIRRATVVLREEGIKSFYFKVLGEIGYRRLLVFERSLEKPVPVFASGLDVRIRQLEVKEAKDYLVFRPETPGTLVADRITSGHLCFAAWYGDGIVGATWAATQHVWIDYLAFDFPLAVGEVHTYDVYTLPEYRGHGISPAISVHMLRYFAESGYRIATRTILPENRASLRARAKAGYQLAGKVVCIRIGPLKRHYRSSVGKITTR